jgi:3-isopropylmalate/(R)-2-methylmalate dehydratase small subunit|tara:strand:- start:162 stop:815 length:654 start_codon:yes stop_codon:yes gene_type:complete
MEALQSHSGLVIPFNRANVDTDAMLPKQYLKSILKTGYGDWLFDGLRYFDEGDVNTVTSTRRINPEFVLNLPRYSGGSILVAGENFGCGSSREHAPWAFRDFGIKVVIASSFADIFYNNCCKNGVLPVQLASRTVSAIIEEVEATEGYEMDVDLEEKAISLPDGKIINFEIDDSLRQQLLHGLDTISLTMEYKKDIMEYEAQHRKDRPWLFTKAVGS